MTTRARDEIVEAAFRLFLERGYEATSLARILDTVPYSKGAVYHHFASKEALLEAVIERFFTSLLDPTDAPRPTEPVALAHRMVDDYVDAIDAVAPYASPTAYYAFLTSVAPRASEAIGAAHTASAAELAGALEPLTGSKGAARDLAHDLIALVEGTGLLAALRGVHPDRAALHAALNRALPPTSG
ncbi:MAG: TetR/AcrR family transcriptional regulator [Microcella pacifica]|uniref:TetR/AcrR family transcriptional regulator n=1 Tax=Microcella pacifica TaxID=2591847 RepID=A0A9E5JMP7_9MICO|nr:TetR/AcrR family transcriptional regulator [Microcella pacifica]NHF63460.1 TetR/AcrR family transcriptional regulator [Microcella pacifica]